MIKTLVSVIIPTYNQAKFLAESVQSALDQTYQNIEVIVVNDASTDHTDEVMSRFNDPRIKYITHEQNRYAAAARNTGIHVSSGEFIAFLDADDRYHPEKLNSLVTYLEQNPEIGLTYNSRFEINETGHYLKITKAPLKVTLSNLVMDFPFGPSDVVMRKSWANRVGMFDESFKNSAEDPDFFMRLALDGCQLFVTSRCLNDRRIFAHRKFEYLEGVIADQVRAFEKTFSNPHCPQDILPLREKSLAQIYLIMSYLSFVQNRTDLGQDLLQKSIFLDSSSLDNEAKIFLYFLINSSIRAGGDHEKILQRIFSQLPSDLECLKEFIKESVAYGYLLRGIRDIIWDRIEPGTENFNKATAMGAQPNKRFLQILTQQLMDYESEFGAEATQEVLTRLTPNLKKVGNQHSARQLQGCYLFNRAFQSYHAGEYTDVPSTLLDAISNDTGYFFNRGTWSVMLRSILYKYR